MSTALGAVLLLSPLLLLPLDGGRALPAAAPDLPWSSSGGGVRTKQLVVKRGSADGPGVRTGTATDDLNTLNSNNATVAPPSPARLKLRDHMLSADTGQRVSIATQSVLTFVTVFVFGCAVGLTLYAWKRFSDSTLR